MTDHKNIHEAMLGITEAVPRLQKEGKLVLGGSSIKTLTSDTVLEALRPIMLEHRVVCYPSLSSHRSTIHTGGTPRNMQGDEVDDSKLRPIRIREFLEYDFRFVHVDSETEVTMTVPGEGMGNDDKGTRKASTSAQKTAYILAFHLITGEPDPDTLANHDEAPVAEPLDRGAQQRAIAKTPGAKTAAPRPAAKPAPTAPPTVTPEPAKEPVSPEASTVAPPQADGAPLPEPTEPPLDNMDQLKARVRQANDTLGMDRPTIDAFATEVTGKTDRADWINSPRFLAQVVKALEAKVAEASA